MPLTNYPQGVSSFGMPVIGGGGHMTTGNVFFVDSGATEGADVTANGESATPFITLDFAIGQCTANNGDMIFVMPGHAETLAADSAVDMDVAGVTVIGLGKGASRPTFTLATLATADFKMAAANLAIHNLLFLSNIGTLAMIIEVSGDDCEIGHCEFREGTASMLTAITVGVADGDSDRCHIHDCTFRMDEPAATNTGNAAIEITFDNDNIVIEDNWIFGDFDEAGIDVVVGGNASDHLIIRRNYVENTAAGQFAVELDTGGTMVGGAIVDNRLVSDEYATLLEPHTLQCVGNKGNNGVTGSGDVVVPGLGVGTAGTRMTIRATGSMAAGFGTADDPAIFTVTGAVMCRCWGIVTVALASTLNTGAISIGVPDNNALFSPAVVADGTDAILNDVIANTIDAVNGDNLETGSEWAVIAGGVDIQAFITVNNMTAGDIDFYCEWIPLTTDGDVT